MLSEECTWSCLDDRVLLPPLHFGEVSRRSDEHLLAKTVVLVTDQIFLALAFLSLRSLPLLIGDPPTPWVPEEPWRSRRCSSESSLLMQRSNTTAAAFNGCLE